MKERRARLRGGSGIGAPLCRRWDGPAGLGNGARLPPLRRAGGDNTQARRIGRSRRAPEFKPRNDARRDFTNDGVRNEPRHAARPVLARYAATACVEMRK